LRAPPTRTTGGPSPTRSNAIEVPSADVTVATLVLMLPSLCLVDLENGAVL
jgi:hypothetical protein